MQNQAAVSKKQDVSVKKSCEVKPWEPEDKLKLSLAIGQAFDMQKQFGKTTGQLENIVAGFCWIMEPYPVGQVIAAFAKYVRENSDMPTPSDLVKIIDPKPPEWKPDKSYYIRLLKIREEQGPFGLDQEEIEYIMRYEAHMKQEMKERA